MQQVRVVLQEIKGVNVRGGLSVLLDDNASFETILPQIPKELLARSERRINKSRDRSSASAADRARLQAGEEKAIVNGYKLFFYRTMKQQSIRTLGNLARVPAPLINQLEQVSPKKPAPNCFKTATRSELSNIEKALGCIGKLEYGQSDDLLATYLMYYKVNYKTRRGVNKDERFCFEPDTRAVVFDFGGTLSSSNSPLSTWERMWVSVDYTIEDAGQLQKLFLTQKISHQEWCDQTCRKLRAKGFTREHMRRIIADIRPVNGLSDALRALSDQGTALYIVSGSIREIIAGVVGDNLGLFTEIKANDVFYDDRGVISEIRGHPFDFEGKAKFISRVAEELGCDKLEVLFVGNSLNDSWASESGARTLCVNPAYVDYANAFIWTYHIRNMQSLSEILRYAVRRKKSSGDSPR